MLVVDHYDSYTWNLVHLIATVTGTLPEVVEHDTAGVLDLARRSTHVVLSPGPGHPCVPADFALGPAVFSSERSRLLNKRHLNEAHEFYEKYGGKTIILARFVPIVRTFAPFVAGIGAMTYSKFILYNVVGAKAWVAICLFAGYWFGNMPWVAQHFEVVLVGIIFVSILPIIYEYWKSRAK